MIDVQGLRYTYSGADQPALRGLDFSVRAGEVFGFLGSSGAGKSTTQKMSGVAAELTRNPDGTDPTEDDHE